MNWKSESLGVGPPGCKPAGAGQATAPGKRSASGRRLQAGERWITEAPAYPPVVHALVVWATQLSTAGGFKRGL